jgi:hypothetical protein
MKKIILITSLLVSSFSFGADWVFIAEATDVDQDYYVDVSSYSYNKTTDKAKIWYKRNVFSGSKEYTDTKTLVEYDCGQKKERYLAQSTYNIDGYALSNIDSPSTSRFIAPDTVGDALWEAACKVKGSVYNAKKPNFVNMERIKKAQLDHEHTQKVN